MKFFFSSLQTAKSPFEWISLIEEVGMDGWEIVDEGSQELSESNLQRFKDILSTTNLEISVHAPFSDINLASVNDGIWSECVKQVMKSIEMSAEVGAKVVVIHPGHYSPLGLQLPERVWERCLSSIRVLSKRAEECGVILCVENMTSTFMMLCKYPEEMRELIESVETENLGIALDIGHANLNGNLFEFLRLERIEHMHVHDNNGKEDEHLAVGEGSIDWRRFTEELEKTGFKGALTIEVRSLEEAIKSMQFLKNLLK